MDARLLGYFLAVVDHDGFGRAAAALHISQPALSQAIAGLERELHVELFHRVGRGVVLSDAGAALVVPARQVLRDLEIAHATVESTKGLQRGRVQIASMPSPGIEPLGVIVRAFLAAHPGLSVDVLGAFEPADVVSLVAQGRSEVGLIGTPEPIRPPGIGVYPIEQQPFVLIAPPDPDLVLDDPLDLVCVEDMAMVVSPAESLMRQVVLDAIACGAGLRIVAEVAHRTSILAFVVQGIGCAVVPSAWTLTALAAGLKVVAIDQPARLHIALLRREGMLSPAASAFVEVARRHARGPVTVKRP